MNIQNYTYILENFINIEMKKLILIYSAKYQIVKYKKDYALLDYNNDKISVIYETLNFEEEDVILHLYEEFIKIFKAFINNSAKNTTIETYIDASLKHSIKYFFFQKQQEEIKDNKLKYALENYKYLTEEKQEKEIYYLFLNILLDKDTDPRRIINPINERDLDLLFYKDILKMTEKEIAEDLKTTVNTIHTKIFRARKNMEKTQIIDWN